jgi:hypothetical protein
MQVYEAINAAIAEIMQEGNATTSAILSFDRAAIRVHFLFGSEVELFLGDTRKRMVALRYAEARTKTDNDEIRARAADLAAKHMNDLVGFSRQFASLIAPYWPAPGTVDARLS